MAGSSVESPRASTSSAAWWSSRRLCARRSTGYSATSPTTWSPASSKGNSPAPGRSTTASCCVAGTAQAPSPTAPPGAAIHINYYTDTGDAPGWVDECDNTSTRDLLDPVGDFALLKTGAGTGVDAPATHVVLQLHNLHGVVIASMDDTSGAPRKGYFRPT